MPAVKVLRDHVVKLAADNEYLERQIVFLAERLEQYRTTLKDNCRCIVNIEAVLEKIQPSDRCPLERL